MKYLYFLLLFVASIGAMDKNGIEEGWGFCSGNCKGGVHIEGQPCPDGRVPAGYEITEKDWSMVPIHMVSKGNQKTIIIPSANKRTQLQQQIVNHYSYKLRPRSAEVILSPMTPNSPIPELSIDKKKLWKKDVKTGKNKNK